MKVASVRLGSTIWLLGEPRRGCLYVLSGVHTPAPLASLTLEEDRLLGIFRRLPEADQAAVRHLLSRLSVEVGEREAPRMRKMDRQALFELG